MSAVIVIINTVHPAGVLPACNVAQSRSFPNTHQLPFSPLASSRRRPHPDNLPLLETADWTLLSIFAWAAGLLVDRISGSPRLSCLFPFLSFFLNLNIFLLLPGPYRNPYLIHVSPHFLERTPQTHTHVQTSAKTVTVLEGFP